MREVLGSDRKRLTAMVVDVCGQRPLYRDFTSHELHEALRAIAIRLPIDRTYFRDSREQAALNYIDCVWEAVKHA
jgi:maltooligosyltrehalose synthase